MCLIACVGPAAQLSAPAVQVAASRFFSTFIDVSGQVFTFGGGYNGELGHAAAWAPSARPVTGEVQQVCPPHCPVSLRQQTDLEQSFQLGKCGSTPVVRISSSLPACWIVFGTTLLYILLRPLPAPSSLDTSLSLHGI